MALVQFGRQRIGASSPSQRTVPARAGLLHGEAGFGVFYRRIRSFRGGLVASKALGRMIAQLCNRVMAKGLKFVEDQGIAVRPRQVRGVNH